MVLTGVDRISCKRVRYAKKSQGYRYLEQDLGRPINLEIFWNTIHSDLPMLMGSVGRIEKGIK